MNFNTFALSKMYSWSVIFEPLFLFILIPADVLGFRIFLSKSLQLYVLIVLGFLLFIGFLSKRKFKLQLPDFNSLIYGFVYIFLFSLFLSFFVGWQSGQLSMLVQTAAQASDFSPTELRSQILWNGINGVIVAVYYFVFFSFLSATFLDTRKKLSYFFLNFRRLFFWCLILGYIDFVVGFTTGFDLIPRHIYGMGNIGIRWHGMAGEPRQAGIYLLFGLAILHLESLFYNRKIENKWYLLTIPAIILTQSATTILAVVMFVFLHFITAFLRLDLLKIRNYALIILPIFLGFYLFFDYDTFEQATSTEYGGFIRISLFGYYENFSNIIAILDSGIELPYFVKVQLGDTFPLYDLWVMLRNGDYMPVLFGSGIGSAAVNNYGYIDSLDAFGNPNAQGVRLLYESGLFGTACFFLAFYTPLKLLSKNFTASEKNALLNFFLLMFAAFFSLRSPTIYIYLGIMIATLGLLGKERASMSLNQV